MAGDAEGIASAVDALRESYDRNAKETRAIGEIMDRRFGRQRLWILVIAAVVILAIVMSLGFRSADQRREEDRRRTEYQREVDQRETLLAGCKRGNDQRAALRRVIERAYTPSVIPEGLSEELRSLIIAGQERQASLRIEQLADPGVQPVDCESAFPPVTEDP